MFGDIRISLVQPTQTYLWLFQMTSFAFGYINCSLITRLLIPSALSYSPYWCWARPLLFLRIRSSWSWKVGLWICCHRVLWSIVQI